jgi:hypothetical protein
MTIDSSNEGEKDIPKTTSEDVDILLEDDNQKFDFESNSDSDREEAKVSSGNTWSFGSQLKID